MNKKIAFFSFLAASFLCVLHGVSHAEPYGGLIGGGENSIRYTHMASSGVVSNQRCRLVAVEMSSGAIDTFNWGVVFDSAPQNPNSTAAAFLATNANRASPTLMFRAQYTNVSTSQTIVSPLNTSFRPNGEFGISMSSGIYWLPSVSASGEAYRANIYWRPD